MVKQGDGALGCLCPPAPADSGRRPVWLISFGDLLTLLWCMMLSLVCYGHFRPVPLDSKNPLIQELTAQHGQPAAEAPSSRSVGTALAPHSAAEADAPAGRIFLTQRDFVDDALTGDAETKLYDLLAGRNEAEVTVTVESCADGGASEAWLTSINRTLLVRSKLLNAGLERRWLRLRAAGRHCAGVRTEGAPEDAVVAVAARRNLGKA